MTGFRLMQDLHAYSGGTVRDFHPVFYSPAALLPHPQALKRNIYFCFSIHLCVRKVNQNAVAFLKNIDMIDVNGYHFREVVTMTEAEMIQCAIDECFAAAAIVDTAQIVFDPSFRLQ